MEREICSIDVILALDAIKYFLCSPSPNLMLFPHNDLYLAQLAADAVGNEKKEKERRERNQCNSKLSEFSLLRLCLLYFVEQICSVDGSPAHGRVPISAPTRYLIRDCQSHWTSPATWLQRITLRLETYVRSDKVCVWDFFQCD